MIAGISTASLFMRLETKDTLPLFDEWNVPQTEVFLTSFCEYEPRFAKAVAPKKGNVAVHSVHTLTTQFEPQLYSAHPRVRQDAFRILDKALKSANAFGARYYTFHGVARIKRTSVEDLERWGLLTAQIAEYCAERGVTLCLENVEWAMYNRPGVFRALKRYCPALKGVLDVKQARVSGNSYEKYLEEMGEDITHVHVCDHTETGKNCLPGQGTFDFDGLFSELKQIGFRGPVLIENYGRDYADLGMLKRAFEYLAEKAYKFS